MKILALEPYYGGSHRAFLDGWAKHSRHDWTVLGLPANKWKWRMRHSPVTLAEDVRNRCSEGEEWDVVFCSDMLNLAEFKGLVGAPVGQLPALVYFHENQLTYPCRANQERDLHFGLTNFTTALAADDVWFNSEFHRDEFLQALVQFLKRMPDYQHLDKIDTIRSKSLIRYPCIQEMPPRGPRRPGPPRVLWVARWEHDKGPGRFFQAMETIVTSGLDFRLSVLGQRFSEVPDMFVTAKEHLTEYINQWGYLEDRNEYTQTLLDSDIVVSTADHEFFGIGIVEAIAAGAWPILPDRLSYPEIMSHQRIDIPQRFFYDGSIKQLVSLLTSSMAAVEDGTLWGDDPSCGVRAMREFSWKANIDRLDDDLERVVG